MSNNYSYDQYLEQWDDHFGNDTCGEFVYWQHGIRKSKTFSKMTEKQFRETLIQFDKLSPEIDILQRRDDYSTNDEIGYLVDSLLAESFKCELPLFF